MLENIVMRANATAKLPSGKLARKQSQKIVNRKLKERTIIVVW